jgi:glucose/arabinose dehydrogenase
MVARRDDLPILSTFTYLESGSAFGCGAGLTHLYIDGGRLRIIDAQGRIGPALDGLPAVDAEGQGGLLDVVLAPDYAKSQEIFFSYAEPRSDGNGTAVAKARLALRRDGGALENLRVIFHQQPSVESAVHFGSRLAFAADGTLFVTLGERGSEREQAPRLDSHLGKVVRITRDGQAPADNPYVKTAGARAEIWSVGHRNLQGAALHPATGQLWTTEHGPQGGDELNTPEAGRDYGWPRVSDGVNYDGTPVGDGGNAAPGLEPSRWHWTPSIAPSGLAFYTATRFAPWRGNLFAGSLKFGYLARLTLEGDRVVSEERLLQGINRRIRDVRQGPDGALYLLTDEARGEIGRAHV